MFKKDNDNCLNTSDLVQIGTLNALLGEETIIPSARKVTRQTANSLSLQDAPQPISNLGSVV